MQCVRAVKWFTSLTSDVRKAWKAFALLNTETDRITNSLNTLREQVVDWMAGNRRSLG